MSERMPMPDVLDEVRSIAPETDQRQDSGDDLVDELFPGAKMAEKGTQAEKQPNLPESPVFVWSLEANISSHEQLRPIIDQIPEIHGEYDPIEAYAPIDGRAWEAHRNIIHTGGTNEDIGAVLEAWKYASDQFDRLYHAPTRENSFIQDYWDSKSMNYHQSMEMIIHPGKRDLIKRLSDDESDAFSGVGRVEQLLADPEFEHREEMLDYLTYRLWVASNVLKMSKPYPGEEFGPGYHRNKEEYEQEKKHLMPLVVKATQAFAEEGNSAAVRRVLENLETMGESEIAVDMLAAEGLSDEARLNIAVQQMNVFGVVPTIERISARDNKDEALTRLYRTLQGQDIETVMNNLTEVYKAVDFHEYVLNNPELTARESALVQAQVEEYAKKVGKSPQEVRIIDVGAGTGRHSVALHKQGYDVTALEYEHHHVQKIKEQDPDIKAVVVDWHNVPYPDGRYPNDVSPEVFYCLGRTILHNNSPEKMARFFDEMHRVLGEDGVGIIDIPKVPEDRVAEVEDEYSDEIRRYAEHLESLGVEPGRARNIFDGPDEKHKFNRMAMTDTQFKAYAKLFGFRVKEVQDAPIGEAALFDNSYYVIEKDPEFVVDLIPPQEFREAVADIGLLDPGVDYNRRVDAWDLPLGIPIMYMSAGQADALWDMRDAYRRGRLGEISTQLDNGTIYFEVSHRPTSRKY